MNKLVSIVYCLETGLGRGDTVNYDRISLGFTPTTAWFMGGSVQSTVTVYLWALPPLQPGLCGGGGGGRGTVNYDRISLGFTPTTGQA